MSRAAAKTYSHVNYLWDESQVPGDPVGQLLIRSNWLGADLRITNFAGGNTSVKCAEKDPLTGELTEVMWIKGSGGDLGTMKKSGLAGIEMKKFFALKKMYKGQKHEDEMVGFLPHCTFNLVSTAASIDTPLHAFIPRPHVDHLHPDSIIAIAASKDGERLTKEIFGGTVAWIPWQRPGFDLGLKIGECYTKHPGIKGIILGGHGLFSWADTARECYEITLDLIETAAEYLAQQEKRKPAFGGPARSSLAPDARKAQAAKIMPVLRGLTSTVKRTIGHFRDDAAVMQFLESKDLQRLAAAGTSCPDHFLRTKRTPLVLDLDPSADPLAERAKLAAQFDRYRSEYAAYYERCKRADSPALRPPDPAIVLWPGVGLFSFAKDKPTARVAAEFYVNAINVMRGAESVSSYVAISEQEAFNIEYWALEEAKLRRLPPEAPLSRRVAIVSGSGSGIGKAIAEKLAKEGACVVVADLNEEAAKGAAQSIAASYPERAVAVKANVTEAKEIQEAFAAGCLAFGGVDLVVNNAGLSISKPLSETTEKDWDLQYDVMARGSFLASQAAAKCFDAQGISQETSVKGIGADVIYIVSKNALVAQPNNIAYGSAKAAQLHQMRLLAAELGPKGVRVNAINPDAVVRGSGIFASGWGADRAKTYGINEDQLPAFYASRTLLNLEILPEDIANAAFCLVAGQLSKSTGMTIPVDGGLAPAFQR